MTHTDQFSHLFRYWKLLLLVAWLGAVVAPHHAFAAPGAAASQAAGAEPAPPEEEEGPLIIPSEEEMRAREAVDAFSNLHAVPPPAPTGPKPFELVNEEDPEGHIPFELQKKDVLAFGYYIMELGAKAEAAFTEKRYPAARKYFRAMAKAVPDEAYPFRRLCAIYVQLGEHDDAGLACQSALRKDGVVLEDAVAYVDFAVNEPEMSSVVREELDAVVEHIKAQPGGEVAAAQLNCKIGARLIDTPRLEACVATLTAQAPNEPATLTYAWALAVARNDAASARQIASHAEELKLPAEVVQEMRAYVERGLRARAYRWLGVGAVVVIAAVALLFLRRRRLPMTRVAV